MTLHLLNTPVFTASVLRHASTHLRDEAGEHREGGLAASPGAQLIVVDDQAQDVVRQEASSSRRGLNGRSHGKRIEQLAGGLACPISPVEVLWAPRSGWQRGS